MCDRSWWFALKQRCQNINQKIYQSYLQGEETKFSKRLSFKAAYFFLLCFGFVFLFKFNFSQFYRYRNFLRAPLWIYQTLLAGITMISYYSLQKFNFYRKAVLEYSKEVVSAEMCGQAERHLAWTERNAAVPAAVVATGLSISFLFFSTLRLANNVFLFAYAGILAIIAAFSSAMAYISLINLIIVIYEIYQLKFEHYVFYYPISTNIFRQYNHIIVSGLIRFWAVSILLLLMIFFALGIKGFQVVAVVSFIILGFILFTLYPFYFTQVKISELKMQTIATIVGDKPSVSKKIADNDMNIIKMVQNSPSQTSSNFQMLFWSTAVAGCSFALEKVLSPLLTTILQ